jgi:bifunctional non-homologous end joining protein LigD
MPNAPVPRFIKPMAASLVSALPDGDEWLYEAKFDGYRAIVLKDHSSVRILSRKGNDLSRDYPSVVTAVQTLSASQAVLDGEIVAFDDEGRPSFQQLQHRGSQATAIRFFAFDLLHLNGSDLLKQPLEKRKARLRALLKNTGVEFSDELPGRADAVLEAIAQVGLEGVVAKRRDSTYDPGVRSRAWLKLKLLNRQEFVVGGYKPEGGTLQSLVVGYYEGKALRFAGRVKAGLTPAHKAALFERMKSLETSGCPFADLPTGKTSHWGEGVTEDDMKKLRWVRPTLVAEIGFTEWTRDGHLRHSTFAGLREDKSAREVVRET